MTMDDIIRISSLLLLLQGKLLKLIIKLKGNYAFAILFYLFFVQLQRNT